MFCSYSSLKSNPNAPNSISNRNSISFWNEMSLDNECYELIEAKETIFVKKMCENLEGSLNYPFWLYLNGYGPLQIVGTDWKGNSIRTQKNLP